MLKTTDTWFIVRVNSLGDRTSIKRDKREGVKDIEGKNYYYYRRNNHVKKDYKVVFYTNRTKLGNISQTRDRRSTEGKR